MYFNANAYSKLLLILFWAKQALTPLIKLKHEE